ncbi:nitroreductase family deazaflavin-dependent oxidoreductase [Saccharopolyspora rhizosphaerae]|uniref:Nitroreductase family deazaflavin-dependent oxidoreductase n=1 Tax=Saccharopolyspora rhizosphaerae TaxID=2492662 RepID=A0A3R8QDT8_9PSEU|nr:nitroreductase family deazaflavin-dependent oxidoreductase [Saccharopolyspora rhizosphaerae]RRO18712.1 nitroreductase family deazaflavin-dependent oxidoreductase [Saccharopolyspora rhizosphaerae]
MTSAAEWNQKIIDEFRRNGGRVGGQFEGAPMLLLHHVGAKSGTTRVNPLMHQETDHGWAVFASAAGAEENPDWYHNLRANPEVEIELGTETIPVRARVLDRAERDLVWEEQKRRYPGFADYESKTSRTIPVVLLERR